MSAGDIITYIMLVFAVIVNIAFMVPAAYTLGDHLAFQAAVDTTTVVPTIVGKLKGGALAIVLALLLTRPKKEAA